MQNRTSNYDIMRSAAAKLFLSYDQGEMIRKLSLVHDDTWLYLPFVGRMYRIDRKTGSVTWSPDGFQTAFAADFEAAMTLYDVLCYSKSDCHPAHAFANLNSVSSLRLGNLPENGFLQGPAADFTGKALAAACQALSGKRLDGGDVAYELALFPFLSVVLRFWEADEEFPSSLQILVDQNVLDFMHYETLMYAMTHLLRRLREEECAALR